MRVLLTGHQGYLGTVLADMLTAAGHDVMGLDSGLFADCVLGPHPADPPGLGIDIREITSALLTGLDAVIHLAALSNDALGSLKPQLTYDVNYHASLRLARLAKWSGAQRFLYASTCMVYGTAGDDLINEDAPLRPTTPYAESKVWVEDALLDLADDDFSPVMLRVATAFGYSPRLRTDLLVNNLVGHAVLTGKVLALSDRTSWRSLVHVRDVAEAFLLALSAPRHAVHARALNVGHEANNLTIAEVAAAVAGVVPGTELMLTGDTDIDPRSYRVDFSAVRAALPGYHARWTVPAGAMELVEAYRRYALTATDFDLRFTRLARLQQRRADGSVDEDLTPQ